MHRAFAIAGLLALSATTSASAQSMAPQFVNSPWPTYHQGPWRQASTPLAGPSTGQPKVQVSRFKHEAGEEFGTSPWHYLSDTRYSNSRTARTIWGVSLKYIYKYELDGETFRLADSHQINRTSLSIGWNFMALADGRVVVPSPLGMRMGPWKQCRTREPSLLTFEDGATSGSPIRCIGAFQFTPQVLQAACGFRRGVIGTTAIGGDALFDGSISARIIRNEGGQRETYMAVLDNALTRIKTCAKVADGRPSNGSPMTRGSGNSTTVYIPTDDEIVAVNYDPAGNTITRTGSVNIPFRGRTGTTPTIVEAGGRQFIVVVDARCAVEKVFTGAIACTKNTTVPSALVAVPLPLGSGPAQRTDLPGYIDTVENSPAAWRDWIVVTNYTGYTPDGKKDGKRNRATGVVGLQWDDRSQVFVVRWSRPEIQMSGVPTISGGSGLVYSSGSETDRTTYFYGLRITDGATVVRLPVGPSYATRGTAGIFDAGNNTIISDDGSAIWPGGESLVRVWDRQHSPPRVGSP